MGAWHLNQYTLKDPNIFRVEGQATEYDKSVRQTTSLRCPHCFQLGSFEVATRVLQYFKPTENNMLKGGMPVYACIRVCPNSTCRGIVFTVDYGDERSVLPPELLDFDADGLPPNLLLTLKEAISCHAAGAYRASAMMVRRLLEEICEESGAEGKDLHARLNSLKAKIILPQELFEAMGELKALGNDAAHIIAKSYMTIGKDECEDSIELAKEILKARYQLKGLVDRLKARRGATP